MSSLIKTLNRGELACILPDAQALAVYTQQKTYALIVVALSVD